MILSTFLKCWLRNTVGTVETISCLFALLFPIMEIRPIVGRNHYSARIQFIPFQRKTLSFNIKALVTFFFNGEIWQILHFIKYNLNFYSLHQSRWLFLGTQRWNKSCPLEGHSLVVPEDMQIIPTKIAICSERYFILEE